MKINAVNEEYRLIVVCETEKGNPEFSITSPEKRRRPANGLTLPYRCERYYRGGIRLTMNKTPNGQPGKEDLPFEYERHPDSTYFHETRRPSHPYAPLPIRSQTYRKPWYRHGWLWLLVALLGIAGVVAALWAVAGSMDGVGRAVQEQTGALREQTGVLASAGDELKRLTASVNRLTDTIEEAIRNLRSAM